MESVSRSGSAFFFPHFTHTNGIAFTLLTSLFHVITFCPVSSKSNITTWPTSLSSCPTEKAVQLIFKLVFLQFQCFPYLSVSFNQLWVFSFLPYCWKIIITINNKVENCHMQYLIISDLTSTEIKTALFFLYCFQNTPTLPFSLICEES